MEMESSSDLGDEFYLSENDEALIIDLRSLYNACFPPDSSVAPLVSNTTTRVIQEQDLKKQPPKCQWGFPRKCPCNFPPNLLFLLGSVVIHDIEFCPDLFRRPPIQSVCNIFASQIQKPLDVQIVCSQDEIEQHFLVKFEKLDIEGLKFVINSSRKRIVGVGSKNVLHAILNDFSEGLAGDGPDNKGPVRGLAVWLRHSAVVGLAGDVCERHGAVVGLAVGVSERHVGVGGHAVGVSERHVAVGGHAVDILNKVIKLNHVPDCQRFRSHNHINLEDLAIAALQEHLVIVLVA